MAAFEEAWYILKEDTAKKAIIDCLKKEGGAASLDDCAKACCLSKENVRNSLIKWIMLKLVLMVMLY